MITAEAPRLVPPQPTPTSEPQLVDTLQALELLGSSPGERFDRLTRLAQRLFDVPMAVLTLRHSDQKWFSSRIGRDAGHTPRELAFCLDAAREEELVLVPDVRDDERFRNHPCVVDLPEVRFYAACPVRAPDGGVLGTLCVLDHETRNVRREDVSMLTDLAWMIEQELRSLSLATLDELTGLTNRRGFDAVAAHALAMCKRSEEPGTLLFFDLDEFKAINDREGHAAGDRALRLFADKLRMTFRDSDVVARVGGDEFCVLLTSATTLDVDRPLAILAERLRGGGGAPTVKFSVGIASYDPGRHQSVHDLMEDADRAMYRKKFGRSGDFRTPLA